jgi:hypothetical protein
MYPDLRDATVPRLTDTDVTDLHAGQQAENDDPSIVPR